VWGWTLKVGGCGKVKGSPAEGMGGENNHQVWQFWGVFNEHRQSEQKHLKTGFRPCRRLVLLVSVCAGTDLLGLERRARGLAHVKRQLRCSGWRALAEDNSCVGWNCRTLGCQTLEVQTNVGSAARSG
jgi:hypothetical protein